MFVLQIGIGSRYYSLIVRSILRKCVAFTPPKIFGKSSSVTTSFNWWFYLLYCKCNPKDVLCKSKVYDFV